MVNNKKEFSEEDKERNTHDQPEQHTGTVFGSLDDEDQEDELPDDTERDDTGEENKGDVTGASAGAGFNDGTNDAGGQSGNSGGPIGNLSGKYDTNSSSAGGSGTMEKGPGGKTKKKH